MEGAGMHGMPQRSRLRVTRAPLSPSNKMVDFGFCLEYERI